MILFYSGLTFSHVIKEVVENTGEFIVPSECTNELDFYKTVKQDISKYESVDTFILDESICNGNTQEELLMALEMLRTMYDEMKIIVFAPYRQEGDDFLTKCFNMGITNIVNTDDFLELRQCLEHCIVDGMTYREALRFKESKKEQIVVKHEIKRIVNKRLIGVAGAKSNIGVTHNAIVLANFFRKKGFMVALVEMNRNHAFDAICSDYGEKKFEEGYFTLDGVDYYANFDADMLPAVLEHSYNVVLLDMGQYADCDRVLFERCEDRIIVAGAKPWELRAMDTVFNIASKDVLMKYIFCFNFVEKSDHERIREAMGEIRSVYFLNYTVDPFASNDFADGDTIFEEILPEREAEEKIGLFGKLRKRR